MSERPVGSCRGMNPSLFFPDRGDKAGVAAAKAVCAVCPVTAQCVEYALSLPLSVDKAGIFGGLTAQELRRLKQGRNRQPVQWQPRRRTVGVSGPGIPIGVGAGPGRRRRVEVDSYTGRSDG